MVMGNVQRRRRGHQLSCQSGGLTCCCPPWFARLHQAEVIEDMNVHSYRLHPLKGSRKGEWGVTVRANWRITFRFEDGYALDVNLEDYH